MNDSSVTTVQPDSYLTLHYRLSDQNGNEFVSTFDLSPATLQMGSGQLAEPLEHCLIGLPAHQPTMFELDAARAFGEHNPRLVERISRNALPPEIELRENSLIEFGAPDGGVGFSGVLLELNDTTALFDFNHPLAGKPVRFEVEIIGIM
ncbi:MAG: FKBP-type peptidyl-prolyl cis-trans isomerase [Betaproteobacteria bacterium]